MAGIHISSPGLVLNPAAVMGQRGILTAAEAAILDLASSGNLVNWWRAADAVAADGALTWKDRVTGTVLSGNPTKAIVGGAAAVQFDGATTAISGSASIPLVNNFTWIVKLRPTTGFATSIILAGIAASNQGPYLYLRNDGSILAQIHPGDQLSSGAGDMVAGTTKIVDWSWDGTNHKVGFNGVLDTTKTATTPGAASPATTQFRVGSGYTTGNWLNASLFDILQFNAAMRDGVGTHAAQLATVQANL